MLPKQFEASVRNVVLKSVEDLAAAVMFACGSRMLHEAVRVSVVQL